jgi:nucleoside-diphosphate-sugar epimerase
LDDAAALRAVLCSIRPAQVFHFAAFGAYSSQTDLQRMLATNLIGTVNLTQAAVASGVQVLVNAGSSSEYGLKRFPPSESEVLEPNSHYAVTKAAATLFCQAAARNGAIRIPTLRLYSVYGPYEEPSRFVPSLLVHALQGRLPRLADQNTARDFVYIEDVAGACCLAAQREVADRGAIFNIGTGVQTTLRQMVDLVRSILSIAEAPVWGSMPSRAWDTTTWVADNRKAAELLGWQPRYSIERGVRAFVSWLTAHPDFLETYRQLIDRPPS